LVLILLVITYVPASVPSRKITGWPSLQSGRRLIHGQNLKKKLLPKLQIMRAGFLKNTLKNMAINSAGNTAVKAHLMPSGKKNWAHQTN